MPNKVLTYLLTCDHLSPGPISPLKTQYYCYQCQELKGLKDVVVNEWHAKCDNDACNWGHWAGQARQLAERAGMHHHQRTGHGILVGCRPNPLAVAQVKRLVKARVLPESRIRSLPQM